eukprot:GHVP01060312.1.p1 GENE.GHVP01060312.1~~GHVP01060312.1.p1  ORF type:complete len:110 (-),score=11.45 GHVP01060312.1:264-593(-)
MTLSLMTQRILNLATNRTNILPSRPPLLEAFERLALPAGSKVDNDDCEAIMIYVSVCKRKKTESNIDWKELFREGGCPENYVENLRRDKDYRSFIMGAVCSSNSEDRKL